MDNNHDAKEGNTERAEKDVKHQNQNKDTVEGKKDHKTEDKKIDEADVIIKLEKDMDKLKNDILRMHADTENLRRRHKEEIENTSIYAINNFVKDWIEVIENLYRAEMHIGAHEISRNADDNKSKNDTDTVQNVLKGVNMTVKLMESILKKYDISRIDPKGEAFDHELHQAISYENSDNIAKDKVINVIQAGYKIKDRLLRPALVSVSKGNEG